MKSRITFSIGLASLLFFGPLGASLSFAPSPETATSLREQAAAPAPKEIDPWAPFKILVGSWQGPGEGNSGAFREKADFQFILGTAFLQVRNEVRFAPEEKNPKGDVQEDVGFISYERALKIYRYRRFRANGEVIQYLCRKILDEGKTFIFVSEQVENLPTETKVRLTFCIQAPQELRLAIDRALPEKDFEATSSAVLKKLR